MPQDEERRYLQCSTILALESYLVTYMTAGLGQNGKGLTNVYVV